MRTITVEVSGIPDTPDWAGLPDRIRISPGEGSKMQSKKGNPQIECGGFGQTVDVGGGKVALPFFRLTAYTPPDNTRNRGFGKSREYMLADAAAALLDEPDADLPELMRAIPEFSGYAGLSLPVARKLLAKVAGRAG